MNCKHILIALLCISCLSLTAQTIQEGLRYSTLDFASSARSLGIGGGIGAMGADPSAVNINPAGLGEYKFGEFVIGLGLDINNADANLQNTATTSSNPDASFKSISYISTNKPRAGSKWKNTSIALSLNHLGSLNSSFEFAGNTTGSITERFVERANGLSPIDLDGFEAGLAFDTGAIFDGDNDRLYDTDFGDFSNTVNKQQTVQRDGNIIEAGFGFGANYNNKFSIGVSIGIPFVNFEEVKNYTETDEDDNVDFFNELAYSEGLTTTGIGFNAKLGGIYKITKKIRVGAAFHTPSYYVLTDDFSTSLTYGFNDAGTDELFTQNSDISSFEYSITTPWRAVGSAGYIYKLGKLKGFLSGEFEYVDYSSISFNLTRTSNNPLDQIFQDDLNNQVSRELKPVVIGKFGAEAALNQYRFRAGIRFDPSAFEDSDESRSIISLGLGYRKNRFFIDIAGSFQQSNEVYSPYFLLNASDNQTVNVDNNTLNFVLTFGFKT